jgi:hypothetical protein
LCFLCRYLVEREHPRNITKDIIRTSPERVMPSASGSLNGYGSVDGYLKLGDESIRWPSKPEGLVASLLQGAVKRDAVRFSECFWSPNAKRDAECMVREHVTSRGWVVLHDAGEGDDIIGHLVTTPGPWLAMQAGEYAV